MGTKVSTAGTASKASAKSAGASSAAVRRLFSDDFATRSVRAMSGICRAMAVGAIVFKCQARVN